jgi:5'-methylthioadenosine/S-adenosylhomocysteine nucleosidase
MTVPGSRGPIGLIGIGREMALIRQHIAVLDWGDLPWGRWLRGRWQQSELELMVAEVPVGKVGAALGTQGLIQHARPWLIVNCGSAGALAPGLQVGDLVLGNRVVAHDQGIYLETGSRPGQQGMDGYVHLGSPVPGGRRRGFEPDPELLARAETAASRADLSGKRLTGPIVSGDQLVFQDGRKRWLRQAFGALAVENEGAAVAQVAHCYGIPWLVVRGISDSADAAAGFDFAPLLDFLEDGQAPGRLGQLRRAVEHERRHPGTLRKIHRFRRGVTQAMRTVAAFLDVFLPALPEGKVQGDVSSSPLG